MDISCKGSYFIQRKCFTFLILVSTVFFPEPEVCVLVSLSELDKSDVPLQGKWFDSSFYFVVESTLFWGGHVAGLSVLGFG